MKRKLLSLATAAALAVTMASTAVAADKKVLLKVPVYFGTHLEGLGSLEL